MFARRISVTELEDSICTRDTSKDIRPQIWIQAVFMTTRDKNKRWIMIENNTLFWCIKYFPDLSRQRSFLTQKDLCYIYEALLQEIKQYSTFFGERVLKEIATYLENIYNTNEQESIHTLP